MCICSFLHLCIVHVDHVHQECVAAEVEAEGAEVQDKLQEYEVADPFEEPAAEQFVEPNFTNSEPQPGKHRFIDPIQVKFMQAPESFNPGSTIV